MWRDTSAYERGRVLWKAGELIRERAGAIGRTLTMEEGKTLGEAILEVKVAADIFQWYAEEGRRAYGRLIPSRLPGTRRWSFASRWVRSRRSRRGTSRP